MTVLLNRTRVWLGVLGLALLMVSASFAQDLRGMQIFAPAEVTPYGNGPQPKEGYFFVFDGLSWSISRPDVAVIGNATEHSRIVYNVGDDEHGWTQTNTHDTGMLTSARTQGNRIEIGRVTDGKGWLLSVYQMKTQTQRAWGSSVGIVFADDDTWGVPSGGRLEGPVTSTDDDDDPDTPDIMGSSVNLPVIFDDMTMINRVSNWNVELMFLSRSKQFHNGGFMEVFAGVRYMEFDDTFDVDGRLKPTGDDGEITQEDRARDILGDSVWNTTAQNHILGPQVGVRLFKKNGRAMFSTEGRFFAGFNSQNLHQVGTLGSELLTPVDDRDVGEPAQMLTTDFEDARYLHQWSPAVELRAEGRFQLTRSVSVRAGWTGIWMDGIARASGVVDYSLRKDSVMGFLVDNNQQGVFIHGLTLGIDVNR